MKNKKVLALALSAGLVVGGAATSFAAAPINEPFNPNTDEFSREELIDILNENNGIEEAAESGNDLKSENIFNSDYVELDQKDPTYEVIGKRSIDDVIYDENTPSRLQNFANKAKNKALIDYLKTEYINEEIIEDDTLPRGWKVVEKEGNGKPGTELSVVVEGPMSSIAKRTYLSPDEIKEAMESGNVDIYEKLSADEYISKINKIMENHQRPDKFEEGKLYPLYRYSAEGDQDLIDEEGNRNLTHATKEDGIPVITRPSRVVRVGTKDNFFIEDDQITNPEELKPEDLWSRLNWEGTGQHDENKDYVIEGDKDENDLKPEDLWSRLNWNGTGQHDENKDYVIEGNKDENDLKPEDLWSRLNWNGTGQHDENKDYVIEGNKDENDLKPEDLWSRQNWDGTGHHDENKDYVIEGNKDKNDLKPEDLWSRLNWEGTGHHDDNDDYVIDGDKDDKNDLSKEKIFGDGGLFIKDANGVWVLWDLKDKVIEDPTLYVGDEKVEEYPVFKSNHHGTKDNRYFVYAPTDFTYKVTRVGTKERPVTRPWWNDLTGPNWTWWTIFGNNCDDNISIPVPTPAPSVDPVRPNPVKPNPITPSPVTPAPTTGGITVVTPAPTTTPVVSEDDKVVVPTPAKPVEKDDDKVVVPTPAETEDDTVVTPEEKTTTDDTTVDNPTTDETIENTNTEDETNVEVDSNDDDAAPSTDDEDDDAAPVKEKEVVKEKVVVKEAAKAAPAKATSNPKTGVASLSALAGTMAISMAGIVATRKRNK